VLEELVEGRVHGWASSIMAWKEILYKQPVLGQALFSSLHPWAPGGLDLWEGGAYF
jgi:hypothetical protein